MKKKTLDRRVKRTHSLLVGGLMDLMKEKEYEAITVQEILDRANVGRSTFYLHFGSKDELLRQGIEGLRHALLQAQKANDRPGMKPVERLIGFSAFLFEHNYEQRVVYYSLGHRGREMIREAIQAMVADIIKEQAGLLKKREGSAVPLDVLAHFIASSFISLMDWWFKQRKMDPPETVNGLFRSLVLPSLSANL